MRIPQNENFKFSHTFARRFLYFLSIMASFTYITLREDLTGPQGVRAAPRQGGYYSSLGL
jgi:hypothetical protein